MENHVLHKEPTGGAAWDNMIRLEVEDLLEDNIKTSVEVDTRRIVTGIGNETIKDAFRIGYDKQLW